MVDIDSATDEFGWFEMVWDGEECELVIADTVLCTLEEGTLCSGAKTVGGVNTAAGPWNGEPMELKYGSDDDGIDLDRGASLSGW